MKEKIEKGEKKTFRKWFIQQKEEKDNISS